MANIYVVTSGEYSDYRIEGVFTTRPRAERLAKVTEYSEIETYVLDQYGDAPVRKRFEVVVHPENSKILDVRDQGVYETEQPRVTEQKNFPYTLTTELFGTKGTWSGMITVLKAVVYAETEEKARKSATDAVAKYKAEKAGL